MQQHLANSLPLNYGRRYSIKDLRIFLKKKDFFTFFESNFKKPTNTHVVS